MTPYTTSVVLFVQRSMLYDAFNRLGRLFTTPLWHLSGMMTCRIRVSVLGEFIGSEHSQRLTFFSFRPRWNLFPGDLGEWPVIVPDVVFSAVVPITDSRLLEARKLHPGYAFSAPSITDKTLEIPTLIVEYDKIDLLLDDQAPRSQAHRKHLEAAITAALPMHAALGLKTPVFGLFFGRYTADCFAGVLEEVNGVTMVSGVKS